jgi:hypothetical protein
MNTQKYRFLAHKSLRTIGIVVGSMAAAFVVGIQTAGDVQPVPATRASDTVLLGDLNGDGMVGPEDVRIAIEISEGYRTPTPDELAADPNRDFHITIEDAKSILDLLSLEVSAQ